MVEEDILVVKVELLIVLEIYHLTVNLDLYSNLLHYLLEILKQVLLMQEHQLHVQKESIGLNKVRHHVRILEVFNSDYLMDL